MTEARCAGLRHISFSASKDTPETVGEVEVHNKVLDGKGCPKLGLPERN